MHQRPRGASLLSSFSLAILAAAAQAQNWRLDLEVPLSQYQALFDTRIAQGYKLSTLTAREDPVETRFQVTWVRSSAAWLARHNDTPASFAAAATTLKAAGYRPYFIESYGSAPSAELLASAWMPDATTPWEYRVGLTGAQYQTDFNTLFGQGYSASWISGNGSGANARFAGLFLKIGIGFYVHYDLSESAFLAADQQYETAGGRLVSMSTYNGGALYAGIWHFNSPPPRTFLHNRTVYEGSLDAATRAQQGGQTLLVDSRLVAGVPKLSLYQTLDSATNVWTETGTPYPQLAGFDAAVKAYMQAFAIRNGALAVAHNGKLVLARGYTWGPPTIPTTDPTTPFRIASISKSLTAVGVMRLYENGRLGPSGLDTLLKDKLNLGSWASVDPRVNSITLRHLLHHRGGFNPSVSGDPMFSDATVASFLSKPLPITPQDIIAWMRSRPLDFAPGSQYQYSNFGFCLLGRVIEAVTGKAYEDYMYDEVLGPIGAGGARVTDSLFGTQAPNEPVYGNLPGLTSASVMGSAGPATVPTQYGAWNLRNLDSDGGYAVCAIDLMRFAVALDQPATSQLLLPATIAEMFTKYPGDPTTSNFYAKGWVVNPVSGSLINTWHNGALSPDSTLTYLVRAYDGTDWAVLFNSPNGDWSIDSALYNARAGVASWPTHDLFRSYATGTTFGQGCSSTAGTVRLRPAAGSAARIGDLLELRAEHLPTGAANVPYFFVGASRTTWSGLSLPYSLAALGMPGCYANVSVDIVIPSSNAGGYGTLQLRVPNSTALIARDVYFQAMVRDPLLSGLGFAFSTGFAATIGLP